MDGKFLQIWPLKSVTKTMAVLMIIALAVAIYATREVPDNFGDNKEWEFWRNLDFAVCVVSLAFASVLFYGSITEFTMFVLTWMIWNIILTVFWIVFLILKHDELVDWERNFRAVAICLIVFAEIPAFGYFRYLRVKHKADPESNFSWLEHQSDKVYKTLSERPSFSSIDAMFGNTSGMKNSGFQSDSARSSVVSVASEEIEQTGGGKVDKEGGKVDKEGGKVDSEDGKEVMEKENEKVEVLEEGNEGKQDESDVQSQSSFEISVTIHTTKPDESDITVLDEANESSTDMENSEQVENGASTPEVPPSTTEVVESAGQEETSTELEDDQTTQIPVTENGEKQTQITGSMESTDSSVVVEMNGVRRPSHLESSVAVEIDVTETASKDLHQTHF